MLYCNSGDASPLLLLYSPVKWLFLSFCSYSPNELQRVGGKHQSTSEKWKRRQKSVCTILVVAHCENRVSVELLFWLIAHLAHNNNSVLVQQQQQIMCLTILDT